MDRSATLDWEALRARAAQFPEQAYQFVRDGLSHTAGAVHGEPVPGREPSSRHVTGQQLCAGLRDLAIDRYGQLAPTVLTRWGVRATEDFGVLVYAMIDRGELRAAPDDSFEDFRNVFDFAEAFRTSPPRA